VNQSSCTRARPSWLRRAFLPLAFLSSLSCNERPSDLREWRISDHDHTDSPNSGQVQGAPAGSAAPVVAGLEDVTIVAWQQNCTKCHGQLGRGDGPQGPMVKATNLSDPAWQAAATDEQIARAIKQGKGAMPAFPLPDGTIANLVRLVRMMNAARLGAPGGATSAAPGASTTPSASGRPPTAASAEHGGAAGGAPKASVPAVRPGKPAPSPVPSTP
jgi:mono/diheme cytochrome c family protein